MSTIFSGSATELRPALWPSVWLQRHRRTELLLLSNTLAQFHCHVGFGFQLQCLFSCSPVWFVSEKRKHTQAIIDFLIHVHRHKIDVWASNLANRLIEMFLSWHLMSLKQLLIQSAPLHKHTAARRKVLHKIATSQTSFQASVMKILFSILHLFLQGRNDNWVIINIYISINFSPPQCAGQHSVPDKLVATREETVHCGLLWAAASPLKSQQINSSVKTINTLWEKLFNFLSASPRMKRWETGHLPPSLMPEVQLRPWKEREKKKLVAPQKMFNYDRTSKKKLQLKCTFVKSFFSENVF